MKNLIERFNILNDKFSELQKKLSKNTIGIVSGRVENFNEYLKISMKFFNENAPEEIHELQKIAREIHFLYSIINSISDIEN